MARNLMEQMDSGLPLPPLASLDLVLYFARTGNREGEKIVLRLASEGFRSDISNPRISFLLRNRPLDGAVVKI